MDILFSPQRAFLIKLWSVQFVNVSKWSPFLAIVALLYSCFIPQTFAQELPFHLRVPLVSPWQVTVINDGVGPAASTSNAYNFGQITVLDTPRIVHTFTLKNTGKMPLTLTKLQPSCACTTATIQTSRGEATTANSPLPTLAPGQQVAVQVTVVPEHVTPGVLSKFVSVFVQGLEQPITILQITGTVRPSLSFEPHVLDFGQAKAGTAHSLTVTASLDARLVPAGTRPLLVSSNPALQVTGGLLVNSAAAAPGMGPSTATPARAGETAPATRMAVCTYTITLARDAPLGPILGDLSFWPAMPAAGTALAPSAASLLTSLSVRLAGQVVGDVSAQPGTLAFGKVPRGEESARQVMLTAASGTALTNLKVASASPWLSARLGGLPASAAGKGEASRALEIRLRPDAPPGMLQTQVKVTLANGQHLLLPVSAYVASPGAL